VSVGVQTIATPDLGLSYFGLVALNSTVNGIYNVVTTGFVTGTAKLLWTSNPNILLVEGDATTSKVVQKVTLDATVCKPPVVPPTPVVTNNVVIAPVPSRVNTDFSINITLNNPSEAMVLIFNTGGTMLKQIRIPSSQKNHTITTQIGTAGFYIIKVLTLEGEFSKSIIITP
jgi:hypothetical protein